MSVTRVTADAETMMRHAGNTAKGYMIAAIQDIDSELGEGYAKSHPELIAAFMQTAAMDYQSGAIQIAGQSIESGLSDLDHTISNKT